jgi:acid phosphatase family membrane protein YuiD
MTRSILTAIGATFAIIVAATPSMAQTVCGKHADIVERLRSGYEEQQTSAGIAANGSLVEVFASKKGNWTIIFTRPGGMTCLMAVGENWQVNKEPFKVVSGPML